MVLPSFSLHSVGGCFGESRMLRDKHVYRLKEGPSDPDCATATDPPNESRVGLSHLNYDGRWARQSERDGWMDGGREGGRDKGRECV